MPKCAQCHGLMDTEWELLCWLEDHNLLLADATAREIAREEVWHHGFICSNCRHPTIDTEDDETGESE